MTPPPVDAPAASVLVVNDDRPSLYLLSRYLKQGGFRVLEAASGVEALEAAVRERPDLVVLDVLLPDVSGYEVGRRLRAAPATAGVGILYVSAHFPIDALRSTGVGGDAYMQQPVDDTELLTTARLVLQTRQTRAFASAS
ncbi:MAG TPA: response regulator [Polyangiaceae bacterium]|nr:response regulator [Polyangiaceae bacterium]